MKKPFLIKATSSLINILTGLVAAFIFLYFQDWFGIGDLSSYVYWTIPIAIGLSISGVAILGLLKAQNFTLRFIYIVFISFLIAIGWVYGLYLIIGPWINAFSVPVFYLWLIGSIFQLLFQDLLLSKSLEPSKPSETVFRLLGFPLAIVVSVIILISLSLLSSYVLRPESKTFLIPEGYEGMARVVYGEACGNKPEYANGRLILRIPDNGILIVQPELVAGIIDHQYYIVDEHGNQVKSAAIRHRSSGSIGGAMPDGSYSTNSPSAIHYSSFYVTSQDSDVISNRNYALENQRIDSVTEVLVKECRSLQ